MRYLIFLIVMAIGLPQLVAQELNMTVKVASPGLKTVDPKVFQTLEQEVYNFYNNTKWTEDEYEAFEKINGNINITIQDELNATTFTADIYVQCIRPVYSSNYKSQTMTFVDKGVVFNYQELQPLQNSFSNYNDPLSSLLTYYAFLVIGFDYDTFEPSGGDPYFKIAQNIVSSVPQSVAEDTAWDSQQKNRLSRYNVIRELLDPRSRPYRQAIYEYHIKSLDKMHEDAAKARAIMTSSITSINQVHSAFLNSAVVQMFCDAKRKEIVEIYKGASRGDKTKIFDMMVKMDPARTSEYAKIK